MDSAVNWFCKRASVRSVYAVKRRVIGPVIFINGISEEFLRIRTPDFFFGDFTGVLVNIERIKHAVAYAEDPPLGVGVIHKSVVFLERFFV